MRRHEIKIFQINKIKNGKYKMLTPEVVYLKFR